MLLFNNATFDDTSLVAFTRATDRRAPPARAARRKEGGWVMAGDFTNAAMVTTAAAFSANAVVVARSAVFSANGAAHASPGQRPGYAPSFQQALKGRHNRYLAPSGLGIFF